MVISPLALLVCLVGLAAYLVCKNAKAADIGRLMFFAGLLALMLAQGAHVLRIG
jgi:Na+/phosphate symporter